MTIYDSITSNSVIVLFYIFDSNIFTFSNIRLSLHQTSETCTHNLQSEFNNYNLSNKIYGKFFGNFMFSSRY